MNQQERDADRRFAKNFFSGKSDDDSGAGDAEHQGASEYSEEQRRWARELFADDEDSPILAGLTGGKTTGRWRHPEPEPADKGPWYDRRPAVDD